MKILTKEEFDKLPIHQQTGCVQNSFGDKEGKLHRDDGPAVEDADGHKFWYKENKLHRDDGPVIEWSDGEKNWYKEGKLHREDGPAIERADGTKEYYLNDKIYDSYIEWYATVNGLEKFI